MENIILPLLKKLIFLPSTTGSAQEQQVEAFLCTYLAKLPYFKVHTTNFGKLPIKGDPYGRSVVYGLVQGASSKTVILLNHHDVVATDCYGSLSRYAYQADKVTELLGKESSPAGQDFKSGEWLGGRGSCDMKGGIAAQLAFLTEYAKKPCAGSLLFLSVADEESFSAGMRQTIDFLAKAKKQRQLDYRLAINSEPNARQKGRQIVPVGSVGKLLTTIVIQGKSVHLGNYDQGLNPLGLLAHLVSSTEGKKGLRETYLGEKTIPPVWLNMRDRKENYDVSLPLRAAGFCSFQTFNKKPEDILDMLAHKLSKATVAYSSTQPLAAKLPIYTYDTFLPTLKKKSGFTAWQKKTLKQISQAITAENLSYPEATLRYLTAALDFSDNKEPLALLAFAPPYYPPTNSKLMGKEYYQDILKDLAACQPLTYEEYFLGVSDCSYLGDTLHASTDSYSLNTPLWGSSYSFDLSALGQLQIPFLLLGPWGKDLHEKTERVNIKSLTEELPQALRIACATAWK